MGMLFIPKSLLIIATKEVRGSLRLQQFILSNVNERQTKISWQYSQLLLRYSPDKPKCQPHGGATERVTGSPQSGGFTLWRPQVFA